MPIYDHLCQTAITVPKQRSGVLQSACLSVCPRSYIWNHRTDLHNFFCADRVAMARSSSGGVVIRYVLPVLWMTLRLAVMGRMAMRGRLNL